ncbi:MAG: hypothetical protein Q8K98_10185 [Bacteroidota bacterium]|nr:hypothetical protein [Bacteroidota bacterium]
MLINNKNHINPPPVILLGGNIIAVSVARALGKSGIKCYALGEATSEVHYSRFCRGIKYSPNIDKETVYLHWLLNTGRHLHKKPVIIPCSDAGLMLTTNNRTELEKYFTLMEANDEITLAMLDKAETYALAQKVGIPSPKIWHVDSLEDVHKILDQVTYPCLLKPRYSHKFFPLFEGRKLFKVGDEGEMLKLFELTQKYDLQMLITELIPVNSEGYHCYYTHIDENGEPLFHFTKLRPRQYPNLYGLGTYNVSNWNPEVADVGLKFLQKIGLRGIGTVEFIRDKRDSVLKLIECNPRFTGTTELLPICGLNWPLFVYNRMIGAPLPPMNEYKRGVSIIKPAGDFLAFRELNKAGKLTWIEWLKSLMHPLHFYFFRWNDPLVFLYTIYRFLKHQLKKISKRVKNS